MNLTMFVRAGVYATALLCVSLQAGCSTTESASPLAIDQPVSIPDDGVGRDWMMPDTTLTIDGAGDFARPGASAPSQYDGARMFESCVLLINQYDLDGAAHYEVALVRNDRTKSIAQHPDIAVADIQAFLNANKAPCTE